MSNPYFPFYPSDHLTDVNLRPCSAEAKGVWWDMVCLMAQGSPWGFLRIEPGAKNLFSPPDAKSNRGGPIGGPTGGPIGQPIGKARKKTEATLTLQFTQGLPKKANMLADSGSLETDLPSLIGQPESVVRGAVMELERRGVFSRDERGVIYCRRMVKDAERRAQQALYGKAGYKKRQKEEAAAKRGKAAKKSQGGPTGGPTGGPIGHPRPNTTTSTKPKYKTPTPQPPAPRGRGLSHDEIVKRVEERKGKA